MATYNYLIGGGTTGADFTNQNGIRVVVDVPQIIASNATLSANGYIAANDVIRVFQFPIGFVVNSVTAYVHTPCDANVDITVGDSAQAAGFVAKIDADGNNWLQTTTGDAYAGINRLYTSATSTDRTLNVRFFTANATKGKIILTINGYSAFKE